MSGAFYNIICILFCFVFTCQSNERPFYLNTQIHTRARARTHIIIIYYYLITLILFFSLHFSKEQFSQISGIAKYFSRHYAISGFTLCQLLHNGWSNYAITTVDQILFYAIYYTRSGKTACHHFSGKRPTFMPSGNAANKPSLPYSLGSGLCDFWKTPNILQTSVAHSLMIISSLSHVLTTSPEQRRRPRERQRWRRGQQMSGPKATPLLRWWPTKREQHLGTFGEKTTGGSTKVQLMRLKMN